MKNIDINILKQYESDNLIQKTKHPIHDLYIWNYTKNTQFNNYWDKITLMCRGLITDNNGNIIAKGFNKFFNIEENKHTATNSFKIYEKMDGSYISLFYYKNEWIVCSKGSFNSDYSKAAQDILNNKYPDYVNLDRHNNYIFEIISPTLRIVVKYDDEDLILIGIVNNLTLEEYDVAQYHKENKLSFNLVNEIFLKEDNNQNIFTYLKQLNLNNKEGFVVLFDNKQRCKIKFTDYIRLHSIVTNITSYDIWDYLKENKDFNEILENTPDDFYDWVKNKIGEILYNHDLLLKNIYLAYNNIIFELLWESNKFAYVYSKLMYLFDRYFSKVINPVVKFNKKHIDKKIFAKACENHKLRSYLFNIYNGLSNEKLIWKEIKPKFEKPFMLN